MGEKNNKESREETAWQIMQTNYTKLVEIYVQQKNIEEFQKAPKSLRIPGPYLLINWIFAARREPEISQELENPRAPNPFDK